MQGETPVTYTVQRLHGSAHLCTQVRIVQIDGSRTFSRCALTFAIRASQIASVSGTGLGRGLDLVGFGVSLFESISQNISVRLASLLHTHTYEKLCSSEKLGFDCLLLNIVCNNRHKTSYRPLDDSQSIRTYVTVGRWLGDRTMKAQGQKKQGVQCYRGHLVNGFATHNHTGTPRVLTSGGWP